MNMAGQIILAVLALLIIVLGGSQLAGPHLGKYTITDDSIEFKVFGNFRVWKISFDDISDIQLISFPRMLITPSIRLTNRPFARYVLVSKRRGIFRAVLITPDNPEEFINIVQQKLRHAV
jgi:hypothetical protein